MAGAGVAVKFAGTDPYCRGYGPAPHVEVLIARTAPYTGAARAPHLKPPPRTAQAPYTGGCLNNNLRITKHRLHRPRTRGAARPVRGSPEGGPQAVLGEDASAPRGRCPRARAVKGPAWRLGCLVEERDHHPRGRQESSSTIRPVPAGNACRLPVPGPQSDHQPRPGRKHIPEDARGAYLPPWSATPPRSGPPLPDLTERITVFSIDNSATRRCDGTYGSHVGGPLDCGQGWARRPLYDAPTRIKDLRAVQRAHQRPDRSNR